MFKNKILGDGLVIDCLDGKVYSPISGTVAVVAPTNHAYGIVGSDGTSILIHIGVDTVNLGDQNVFKPLVKQGDSVRVGEIICKYEREKIIGANLDHRIMFLVTPESKTTIKSKFNGNKLTKKDVAFNLQ